MTYHADFLKREDCVLLLVDIQKVMIDPCVDAEPLCKHASTLIEIADLLTIPVFFSVHNVEKLGSFLPELLEKATRPNIFNKMEFSCFENEKIAAAIEKTGRRTVILAGIETHVCIFHTGAHASRLGYRVHVVSDAVSSRSILNRKVGLQRLDRAGVVVSSTEMAIFELLNRAGTPEFRSALPLLKTL